MTFKTVSVNESDLHIIRYNILILTLFSINNIEFPILLIIMGNFNKKREYYRFEILQESSIMFHSINKFLLLTLI